MFCRPRREYESVASPAGKSDTVQGCAVPLRKMIGMILNGQISEQGRPVVNEPFYTIDEPNPLRRPDVDLVDIYSHGQYLSDRYQQLIKEYSELVKSQKTPAAAAAGVPKTEI